MNNAKRKENDKAVLECLYLSKVSRYNEIQRGIGKGSDATSYAIKRLMRAGLVLKNGKHYSLSLKGEQLAKGDLPESELPDYGKKKKQTAKTREKITIGALLVWKQRKAKKLKDQVIFLILWLAVNGVTFETVRSENRKFRTRAIKITPSTGMTEILLNQIISRSPYTKVNEVLYDTAKGVAIKDFFSKDAVSVINYCHPTEFNFETSILVNCFKELESQGILQLSAIYNPKLRTQEMRYRIAESHHHQLLQKLIEDLSTLLGYILKRNGLDWQQRGPNKDDFDRLRFLFSNSASNNIHSYYKEVRRALNGKHHDKNLEKTILKVIKNDGNPDEQIVLLDTKINEIRKNILTKSHDVKDKYPYVYELMLRHAYPQL